MGRPHDADPAHPPRLRRFLAEAAAPLDGLRLLPAVGRQLRRREPDATRDVVVVPGWLASSGSTRLLRAALERDGHRVRDWGLGRNTGDVGRSAALLAERVVQLARTSQRPVDLVGWSLGGVVSREVAHRHPEAVRRIVTFGTPLHGSRFTSFAALFDDPEERERVERITERRRSSPPPVPVTVVWSRRDGIVHWRAQQDRENPWAEHVEVGSTHIGMTLDPDLLDVLRDRVGSDLPAGVRAAERHG